MGIMRPNDCLASRTIEGKQGLERLEHVTVAQIPRRARAVIHDPIVPLGIRNEPGILDRVHEALAVLLGVFPALLQKIGQYDGDVRLTGRIGSRERGMTVGGGVGLPGRQTAIPFACDTGSGWVNLVEVVQDRAYRIVQAVQIEPMKCDAGSILQRGVVVAKPVHESFHFIVPPHPNREAGKGGPFGRWIFQMPNVMVHAGGVRPVAFDCDETKTFLRDQLPRNAVAHPVKFRRSMGRFTKKDDPRVADALEQSGEGRSLDGVKRFARIRDFSCQGRGRLGFHRPHLSRKRRPALIGRSPSFVADEWNEANGRNRARKNVAHHYDLDGRLYSLFLDADRQYSCAYFETPGQTLDDAQLAKKRHLAAKLLIEHGSSVLDIGSGWGGLALYLAETSGAQATGITLSEEQLAFARGRAAERELADRVEFRLQDYRDVTGRFERIVSVGMFEHVGVGFYDAYFRKCAALLADDGVFVLHSIGRSKRPGITNPWIAKYIFLGGSAPTESDALPPNDPQL